ncbi:arabinogalactan endo-1,4-beta-galactosidase precursor [mine drainage metagenome]|uniref:arabinogalactan endo-beta-1,4-galactanase n=1 Tax=mine drainage metagenome TaxID=410659 RepID=A0A1J5T3H9_9ZZZZ
MIKLFFKYKYLLIIILFVACNKQNTASQTNPNPAPNPTPTPTFVFAKGADVSWVTQMESSGYKFYDANGTQQDCFTLLKSLGMNSIRLRVWVNPSDGWCNTTDLVAKAVRAKNAGMRIMIDFHYSDSWADPGKQTVPAAWAGQNITSLETSVYNHTQTVLNTLKANNITPTWVQVGNETNDGMLWETGRASTNMANFAGLINAGYNAVKSVDTTIKVIVHISNGYDNNLFRWVFDGLKNNNANWDIIGMSLYPSTGNWATYNAQCLANANDMISRYGKQVMICEVGMDVNSPTVCQSFLNDLITKIKSVSNNNGLGVFYWEPECYNWQSYSLGAFDNTGKPTVALNAFAN